MKTELPSHALDHIGPGDSVTIRGVEFRVKSIGQGLSPPKGLLCLTVMSKQLRDPLTDHTISTIHVDREPYVLDICNGPDIDINTDEIEKHEKHSEDRGHDTS